MPSRSRIQTSKGFRSRRFPGIRAALSRGRLGVAEIIAAKGRVHLYEGHSAAAVSAGVRFLAACGIDTLVLTNAAGVLNRQMQPGRWMAITDHLNFTGTTPLLGGPNFVDMSEVYESGLRRRFLDAAEQHSIELHQGVYAGLLGPQYETPAEVRMLATLGADAVGMSTVLEAIQARALGMRVAGFSCLTNWAAGVTGALLSHNEVLETGQQAAQQLTTLLESVLPSLVAS